MRDRYANFFMNEGSYAMRGKEIKLQYELRVKELYDKYLKGDIKAREYEDGKISLKNELIEDFEKVTDGMFDKEEIIKDFGRVYEVKIDPETLVKPKDIANIYHYKSDPDYTRCKQNIDDMLHLKRRKAETKLIKLRIIKKLHNGNELTQTEKDYLKAWRQAVNEYPLHNLDLNMIQKNHSVRSLAKLSESDKEFFNSLRFFSLK